MRKIFVYFIAILLGPILIFGILFWQKDNITDFWSDAQRMAAAPAPQTFEEVVGSEVVVPVVEPPIVEEIEEPTPDPVVEEEPEEEIPVLVTTPMPVEFNLAVPFTSQAPLANWDVVHEDACEEAAIYMVNAFYEGWPAGKIDPNQADIDLLKIVDYEKALFGFFESTTAAQTAVLAEQMYGYERVEVIEDPTVEDLKAHLVAGRPVIILAAGRMLGNPNFTGEGPLYHALVLKGYTKTTFVTNDPGTRLGADYQYSFDTIMEAMHDWNGGDVLNGAKVVVVIYPNN
ncbi:MAG: C39 family peptidase [Patescibacteria group bacterium]|jgi:hypothetical protein